MLQDKGNMFKEMHKVRNMYLARLHERLARDLMRQRMADDSDRWDWLGSAHLPALLRSGIQRFGDCHVELAFQQL